MNALAPTCTCFAVTAPKLFNALPREIRHEKDFDHFKPLDKTLLFRDAYGYILYTATDHINVLLYYEIFHHIRISF